MTLKIEKIEKDNLRELHQHKINFFTYISHEFKTPLTIILASLDTFFSGERIPDIYKSQIITLKRNVLRLQFLITQLMDFRKIETEHTATNMQYGNVIQFLKELFNAFSTLFKKKELEYIFISAHEVLYMSFDPDKLEKIVSNLLSNAFKYTPEHGEITFRIETLKRESESCLLLTVSDTGKGMTEEQLGKIFGLFYKIEDNEDEFHGTGIGLALTQSLVKLLNGKISVTSKPGEGSSFTVELPYSESDASSSSETIMPDKSLIDNFLIQSTLNESESDMEAENTTSDFLILLVEDNKDLLKFLFSHFKEKYKVNTAGNGTEALALIERNVPDLIITDLMMPQMDGIALCRELKTRFEYSHIPVIMLTAKSDLETRMESLEVGADIYLPKPFILSELELHVRNILSARDNLKKHFLQFGTIDVNHPIRNKDQHFIERVTDIVLRHIDDADFGVTELTRELGTGRTLLHTKLKQILDLSTTEFVNTIRIREAQKLLMSNPGLTMSEVAYQVGFNDPNYFSRTFRKILNVSPTDFRAGLAKGE
jgi:CheY-like chemotaxis protein